MRISVTRHLATLALAALTSAGANAALAGPFAVTAYGSFARMSHTGDASGKIALAELQGQKGLYGVGALQDLRGEVLIWDGRVLVSRGHATDGSVSSLTAGDKAALLATAKVSRWREIEVPRDFTQPDFEKFVKDQAKAADLALDKPFPFAVKGDVVNYAWHVVAGSIAAGGATGAHGVSSQRHANLREFMGDRIDSVVLAGFYSAAELEGAITHPGEQFHVHLADAAFKISGHVDRYGVAKGAKLLLPEE